MTETKTTAGKKIETLARITCIGSKIVGCFAWETPFIRFQLLDTITGTFTGKEVIWCSDKASEAATQLKIGTDVALSCFCYGQNIRRVQISKGCLVFGSAK